MASVTVGPRKKLKPIKANCRETFQCLLMLETFLDRVLWVSACTAERFFRIDRAQENLHYVMDIASENLYILECGGGTVPQTPEDETAHPSPSSNHKTSLVIPEMRIR